MDNETATSKNIFLNSLFFILTFLKISIKIIIPKTEQKVIWKPALNNERGLKISIIKPDKLRVVNGSFFIKTIFDNNTVSTIIVALTTLGE